MTTVFLLLTLALCFTAFSETTSGTSSMITAITAFALMATAFIYFKKTVKPASAAITDSSNATSNAEVKTYKSEKNTSTAPYMSKLEHIALNIDQTSRYVELELFDKRLRVSSNVTESARRTINFCREQMDLCDAIDDNFDRKHMPAETMFGRSRVTHTLIDGVVYRDIISNSRANKFDFSGSLAIVIGLTEAGMISKVKAYNRDGDIHSGYSYRQSHNYAKNAIREDRIAQYICIAKSDISISANSNGYVAITCKRADIILPDNCVVFNAHDHSSNGWKFYAGSTRASILEETINNIRKHIH